MITDREHSSPIIPLETVNLPTEWGLRKEQGKVRDIYRLPDSQRLIIATDRLSAFDQQIGLVPGRGQVLNLLSAWWFTQTEDIVANHLVEVIDPNVMVVNEYPRVDLELVVRGYLTGSTDTSIWRRYQDGQRKFGNLILSGNMTKNEELPIPVFDPTTKATVGHDVVITRQQVIDAGIVTKEEYQELERLALALFTRGQRLADKAGLILVDTKYEFGRDPFTGEFVLIDEIHTPDSSRFWNAFTYQEKLAGKQEPESYDKEFARLWLLSQGYTGNGLPPILPEDIKTEILRRYIYTYEHLIDEPFFASTGDRHGEVINNIVKWFTANE
jgi:phosphoribosylaminoimidazole-succinocarboxamide synthase